MKNRTGNSGKKQNLLKACVLIPEAKQSKKLQREANRARRKTWGFDPVTRKPDHPKEYHRNKIRCWEEEE